MLLLSAYPANGQDSLQIKKIDSIWNNSYKRNNLFSKREKTDEGKIRYSFYKSSDELRTVIVFNKWIKKNIMFFFVNDKIAMISPSGRDPYYILEDGVVYPNDNELYDGGDILYWKDKANIYLKQAYKKIKKRM